MYLLVKKHDEFWRLIFFRDYTLTYRLDIGIRDKK